MADPQCFYCFSKFWAHLFLFCSCDNYNFWPCITHTHIYYSRGVFLAGYSWFEKKIYTLILKFVYITFCSLTEPQTMLQLKILMSLTLFYCEVSSELVHSVHSLLICVSAFIWFNLFFLLDLFLGPCIQSSFFD